MFLDTASCVLALNGAYKHLYMEFRVSFKLLKLLKCLLSTSKNDIDLQLKMSRT